MRLTLVAIIFAVAFFLVFIPQLQAGDPTYKSPWVETDNNLSKLLGDGYKIVGNAVNVTRIGTVVEFIYLQKGSTLFRCSTVESEQKTAHSCEMAIKPEKIK